MSLTFTGTAVYTGDSGTDIDNLQVGGFLAIARIDSLAANVTIGSKTNGGATARLLQVSSAGNLVVQCGRATTSANATAPLANFAAYRLGRWVTVAGRYDTTADAGNTLHMAPVGGGLLPPSAYGSPPTFGSGAVGDDSPGTLYFGNNGAGSQPCTFPLFAFVYFKAHPTISEMQQTADELIVRGRALRLPASVGRAYRLNRGTGLMQCLKSQNTATASGTITVKENPAMRLGGQLRDFYVPAWDVVPSAATGRGIRWDRRRRFIAATRGGYR